MGQRTYRLRTPLPGNFHALWFEYFLLLHSLHGDPRLINIFLTAVFGRRILHNILCVGCIGSTCWVVACAELSLCVAIFSFALQSISICFDLIFSACTCHGAQTPKHCFACGLRKDSRC